MRRDLKPEEYRAQRAMAERYRYRRMISAAHAVARPLKAPDDQWRRYKAWVMKWYPKKSRLVS